MRKFMIILLSLVLLVSFCFTIACKGQEEKKTAPSTTAPEKAPAPAEKAPMATTPPPAAPEKAPGAPAPPPAEKK